MVVEKVRGILDASFVIVELSGILKMSAGSSGALLHLNFNAFFFATRENISGSGKAALPIANAPTFDDFTKL